MADACVFIMEHRDFKDTYNEYISNINENNSEIRNTHINIGTGQDISISELANLIKNIIGFNGDLVYNSDKPDGTLRKLTDVSKLNTLGWKHKMSLENGITEMYDWYRKQ